MIFKKMFMLKFMMLLCVLQLGAVDVNMDGSDLSERMSHWQPSTWQDQLVVRQYQETTRDVSYKKLLLTLAEEHYKVAVDEKAKIEQEAECPEKAQKLQWVNQRILECQEKVELKQAIYDNTILEREEAEKNLLELLSKL